SIAITMKVYGRRSARRTIHIAQPPARFIRMVGRIASSSLIATSVPLRAGEVGSRPPAALSDEGAAVCRSAGMSAERSAGASGSVTGPGSRLAPASNTRRPGTELASMTERRRQLMSLIPGTRCRSARNIVFPGGMVRRSTEGTLVSQRENLGRELFTVNFDSGQKLVLFAHEIEPVSDDLAGEGTDMKAPRLHRLTHALF